MVNSCWPVFGDELADARPVVVSFDGNPASVPGKVWFGRPWQGKPEVSICLPASANNYFSLAVFRPDEAGQYPAAEGALSRPACGHAG